MVRFLFFSTAILISLTLYFLHIRLTAEDVLSYRKIVLESADLHAHSALEKSSVLQVRKGVRKDLWTTQKGKQKHYRIESVQSDMTLVQKKEKIEATEILREIEGWVELENGTQHMVAESGICFFPSCQATFYSLTVNPKPQDRINIRKCKFEKTSHELSCFSLHGRFGENSHLFHADTGYVDLNQRLQPHTLFLEGDVQIRSHFQEKESRTYADSAILNVEKKILTLESLPTTRVLFQQENLEISASTVRVEKAIQAIGDVRFFFYPEEKSTLETIKSL